PSPKFLAVAAGVALFGIGLGAVHRSFEGSTADKVRKGVGVFLTSIAATLFIIGAVTPKATLVWEHVALKSARDRAVGAQRPLIVDFGAAWCTACKELDKVTFARADVREEAGRFFAVKVDATNDEDPEVTATM